MRGLEDQVNESLFEGEDPANAEAKLASVLRDAAAACGCKLGSCSSV